LFYGIHTILSNNEFGGAEEENRRNKIRKKMLKVMQDDEHFSFI